MTRRPRPDDLDDSERPDAPDAPELAPVRELMTLSAALARTLDPSVLAAEDPRRPGVRRALWVLGARLLAWDASGERQRALHAQIARDRVRLPWPVPAHAAVVSADARAATLNAFKATLGALPPAGDPTHDRHGRANQLAVEELLRVAAAFLWDAIPEGGPGVIRGALGPRPPADVWERHRPGLVLAMEYATVRAVVRDPRGEVASRIRAAASRPGSRDFLRRGPA
jgi:hypothetical protein